MTSRLSRVSEVADHPSVIESLRVRAGEVQLGRVLAGICSDQKCASAFARLLLRVDKRDSTAANRAADIRVPRRIRVSGELPLTRRLPGLDQAASARADLFFEGKDFNLVCELKINSGYQPRQLQEYLRKAPVVAVVRNPGKHRLSKAIRSNPNWLGEIAWADIADDLRRLPMEGRQREQWLDLLRVLNEDGDFDRERPPEITEDDRDFVRQVAERVLGRLRRSRDPRARAIAGELVAAPLFDRGPWARARLLTEDREHEFWRLSIKNRSLHTAELRVSWLAWNPARRGQAAMYRKLMAMGFSREYDGDQYRRTMPLPLRMGADRLDQVADATYRAIKPIVDLGLIDYELEFLEVEV